MPRQKLKMLMCSSALALALSPQINADTPQLYLISPNDGDVLTSPVTVRFGLTGMGVAPAGVAKANTGHHHLLIDVTDLPDLTRPIPADANHRHFGGGQTEVQLDLTPGTHRLQLLLGDENHVPHNPPVISAPIHIQVQ